MPWNMAKSLAHARKAALPKSSSYCATYVREALQAGGLTISQEGSGWAKNYGPRLTKAGFVALAIVPAAFQPGDVAVIDGFAKSVAPKIEKDHFEGHMAIYDGTHWISDFVQTRPRPNPYPGGDYDIAKPRFVIYRYPSEQDTKPATTGLPAQ